LKAKTEELLYLLLWSAENKGHAMALRQWAEAERLAWREAVKWDPFLPQKLLPSGYMGRRAWQQRIEVLGNANRDLQTFSL